MYLDVVNQVSKCAENSFLFGGLITLIRQLVEILKYYVIRFRLLVLGFKQNNILFE